MIDDFVKKISYLFEKYGDPSLNPEKYDLSSESKKMQVLNLYYSAYLVGNLRQTVAAGGQFPRVKEKYNGNINDLISKINKTENLDSKMVIFIPNEINNIDHLNKLKATYPDKEIVIIWDDELAFIDDVISAVYMIEYYKSVIDDNLSPLEKITMAYDIVKSHYYKEHSTKHTIKSRHITEMVNNNYIVCVGYVKIFNRLLKEMGISASNLSLTMKSNDVVVNHSRSFIRLSDEKYHIDGYFVFDPTFDSSDKEYYYQFDEKYAKKSKEEKENYQKANPLVSYANFLIPLKSYESKFSNSHDEVITLPNKEKLDSEVTHGVLHTNQNSNGNNALDIFSFVKLLYTIKLAEGYSLDDIPNLIQESLYISGYGYYKIEAINNAIYSITQDIKVGKSKGYIGINLFYIVGIIISLLTVAYCFCKY